MATNIDKLAKGLFNLSRVASDVNEKQNNNPVKPGPAQLSPPRLELKLVADKTSGSSPTGRNRNFGEGDEDNWVSSHGKQDLTFLSTTLSNLTMLKSSISNNFRKCDDALSDMVIICKKWNEKRESADRQKNDIELALDVVYAVDNQLRGIVLKLQEGIHEDEQADDYIKTLEYALKVQDKGREVEVEGNERIEEIYHQVEEATDFAFSELKRCWPIELSKEPRNCARLKAMHLLFKKNGSNDHLYEVVKIFGNKFEKQTKDSISSLLGIISSIEPFAKEMDEIIGDKEVVGKICRNIYRQLSKQIFETHMKNFLAKFADIDLQEKKEFVGVTDKVYTMLREIENKQDVEIMMSMVCTFYFSLIDYINNFCGSLERNVLTKTDQAFENATRTLCDVLVLLDTFAGSFSVFLIKKNIGYSDAIDFSVKVASQFVRVLKAKSDSLKTRSTLHSHLFALKCLDMIEQELKNLKKVSLKLKPGIEKSSTNALKGYLVYCWGHVLGHKHSLEGAKTEQEIRTLGLI